MTHSDSVGRKDRMVTSIKIRNFKTFAEAEATDLRLVNVIVGNNGSGKTALLEALFLAAGVSPELFLRTKTWRGLEVKNYVGTLEDTEKDMWGDLFFRMQMNLRVRIDLKGPGQQDRSLEITYKKPGTKRVIPPSRGAGRKTPTVQPDPERIKFTWEIKGRPPIEVTAQMNKDGITFNDGGYNHTDATFFSATRPSTVGENLGRYSKLSRNFDTERFEAALNRHFKNVSDVSIDMLSGSPMLYARVADIPAKLPLGAISGGMGKLAGILLGIAERENAFVMIDEIENGFYYQKLPKLWETIVDFAAHYNCQLFVSTHSDECLTAAAKIADNRPGDFCLLRTVLTEEGTKIRRVDGERFASAILESNLELR